MEDVDSTLAPMRAMLSILPIEAKDVLARRLHDQLFAPPSARERRVRELRFLATLLDESPQPPGPLPSVERQQYERRRTVERPAAPRAAQLVQRYGSWRRACWAAWGLLADGRNAMGGIPWPLNTSRDEASIDCRGALRACADAIGRLPSSRDYQHWARERRREARERGALVPVPSYNVVLRTLAPDRSQGNGWRLVTNRVFGPQQR